MNILALDTSTVACSVALASADKTFSEHSETDRTHAATVLPKIERVLAQAELTFADIQAIAFGAGPGSFTGVRIGISVAQGLGLANSIPLIAISSLQTVAQSVFRQTDAASVCVAQDARMKEVYTARFERRGTVSRLIGSEQLLAPEALQPASSDLLAGDAWNRLSELKSHAQDRESHSLWPNAIDMLPLALAAQRSGATFSADKAGLDYLRESVTQAPVTHS